MVIVTSGFEKSIHYILYAPLETIPSFAEPLVLLVDCARRLPKTVLKNHDVFCHLVYLNTYIFGISR